MSTNDTVLLLANGAAGGGPLGGDDLAAFGQQLNEVCAELARAIPADGEGASHLITIEVSGCATRDDALQIGRTIANSPLVKTADLPGPTRTGAGSSPRRAMPGVRFDPDRDHPAPERPPPLPGRLARRVRRQGRFRFDPQQPRHVHPPAAQRRERPRGGSGRLT